MCSPNSLRAWFSHPRIGQQFALPLWIPPQQTKDYPVIMIWRFVYVMFMVAIPQISLFIHVRFSVLWEHFCVSCGKQLFKPVVCWKYWYLARKCHFWKLTFSRAAWCGFWDVHSKNKLVNCHFGGCLWLCWSFNEEGIEERRWEEDANCHCHANCHKFHKLPMITIQVTIHACTPPCKTHAARLYAKRTTLGLLAGTSQRLPCRALKISQMPGLLFSPSSPSILSIHALL